MVPRAVQDAGYTAVGLGVLALQEVQTRRRDIAQRVNTELNAAGRHAQAVLGEVIDGGRTRLVEVLHPTGS